MLGYIEEVVASRRRKEESPASSTRCRARITLLYPLRFELTGAGRGPHQLPGQPGGFFIHPPELPGFFLATVPE